MPVVVAPSSPSLQQQQGDAPQLPAVVGGGQGGEVPQHPLLTQSISSAYLQQQANVPPQGNIGGPPPSLYSSPSYSSSQAGAGDTSSIGTQMASPALQGGQPQPLLSSLQVPSVTPQQIQAITQLSPPSNLMTPSLPSPSAPAPPSPLQQQQEYIGVPASVAGGTGISALPSIPALGGGHRVLLLFLIRLHRCRPQQSLSCLLLLFHHLYLPHLSIRSIPVSSRLLLYNNRTCPPPLLRQL